MEKVDTSALAARRDVKCKVSVILYCDTTDIVNFDLLGLEDGAGKGSCGRRVVTVYVVVKVKVSLSSPNAILIKTFG